MTSTAKKITVFTLVAAFSYLVGSTIHFALSGPKTPYKTQEKKITYTIGTNGRTYTTNSYEKFGENCITFTTTEGKEVRACGTYTIVTNK